MSGNFFQLVSNILTETIKNGNLHTYFGEPRLDIDQFYSEQTKWSDFRIMIPTLFLFFHGIELLLKGANYKVALSITRPNHNLALLFTEFRKNYPTSIELTELIDKYVYPTQANCPLLFRFNQSNNCENSSNFYELLKYPYSKNLNKYYQHREIRFLDSEGIPMYKDIIDDIGLIRSEIAKL